MQKTGRTSAVPSAYERQKEEDSQAKALQEQEEKNRKNRIASEVSKCQSYIDMVKGLDTYSNTAEKLLKKAYNALMKIEDDTEKNRMTNVYNEAADYVSELKKAALQESDTENAEEEGGDVYGNSCIYFTRDGRDLFYCRWHDCTKKEKGAGNSG